jgi:ubiquinone/menaquinone biosynthesis C-methylase UbiE
MDDRSVGRMWDENAEVWTKLARAGYDVYRDRVNTPAFFAMLPDVRGLCGLDIGCGEGHNTRLLAKRGASMTAADISETFIRHAQRAESKSPLGIRYHLASAHHLPFADEAFDFATSFMCLMDVPEPERALREAHRIIRRGGFLQFSITHPCFQTPLWRWVTDEHGERVGVVCGRYFDREDGEIGEWIFGDLPPKLKQSLRKFRIPQFDRTLSEWLNALLDVGFQIERVSEPFADEKTAAECPAVADTRHVAYFLIVRCRKPA